MTSTHSPYALLGLVFDPIDMDQTKALIRERIQDRRQLVIATPNINFVATAARDTDFRNIVLNCDLSLADGTPICWIARWLGIPIPERVAGSSLIESFIEDREQPQIKVFFFGGQDNAAQVASETLNANDAGMISVGHINPGFGSVASMSSAAMIEQINAAAADFLIVSLGAKKGHQWIEANKHQLNAPVISHLGAVVNFVAGTQQRSPKLLQKIGMEWLWRIYQEPALYKRYASDAVVLLKLCFSFVLPAYIQKHRYCSQQTAQINYDETATPINISIAGSLNDPLPTKLLKHLNRALHDADFALNIDLNRATYVGSQLAAWLLQMAAKHPDWRSRVTLKNTSPQVARMLNRYGAMM